jgi:hypothetical protein
VLILPSAKDEFVPAGVDPVKLVKRWKGFAVPPGRVSELSGPIPGANHRVDDPEAQRWLARQVLGFLRELEG